MGLIQDWLQRMRERKQEREAYERGENIQEGFHERKKSNEERILERYQEEERQKKIKEIVKRIQKRENEEIWSGHYHNAVDAKNVIKNQKNIFKGETRLTNAPCLFTTGRRKRK